MRWNPTRPEALLLAAALALLAAALFAPALAQPAHIHDFVDGRTLWGVPCALDVLSNVPFLLAGLAGLVLLLRLPATALSPAQRGNTALFFLGLCATAAASSWYHLRPDDAGLAIDRAGMAVAFAGLLGLLAATQVSERAGRWTGPALLLLGPLAAWTCLATGNVLPWALVQFGGMVAVLVLAVRRPRPDGLAVRWILVILAYGAAKAFEMNDAAVFAASGELFSGHTLKHIVAATAALPLLAALATLPAGQNRPGTATWLHHARRA